MRSQLAKRSARIPNAILALIMFPSIPAATASAEEPARTTSAPAASAPDSAAPAAGAVTPSVPPLPLVPGAKVVALWPAGHPTLKGFDQKEVFKTSASQPERIQSVTNVHNPSIELHLAPPEKANGLAIVVAPGGGNTQLVVGTEGTEIAAWLNDLGVSAFILRYRLRPYDSAVDALADTQRAIRLVRANAKEWGVDPKRIGVMGFSAGGEQAARAELKFDNGNPQATDVVEKQSSRPDFAVLVYPGWRSMDLSQVPSSAPPAFLTSAGLDDAFHARQTVEFYNALFNARIPVELHIYGHGGHGNGIKPRNGIPFGTWPKRFVEWATDLGLMKKS
ncbi:MAG TPA: alpha/beta hydrolase [Pirellulales bacterium]|nr:alpha/beta hydrolase [Pirellulales bacterium]